MSYNRIDPTEQESEWTSGANVSVNTPAPSFLFMIAAAALE